MINKLKDKDLASCNASQSYIIQNLNRFVFNN